MNLVALIMSHTIYHIYRRINQKRVTMYISMKKEAKTEFLSIRLSKETKAKLEKEAAADDRTLSWLVAKILEEHLKKG